MYHGTLIIDEADFKLSDGYQEIVKILNCGYMKGMPVLRCEGEKRKFTPVSYDCFSPKIIANRTRFQDPALESRCFTYEMGQRKRNDVPLNLTEEFNKEALEIRNRLLLWRLRNFQKRKTDDRLIIEGIEDRVNQIATPLLSIVENEETRGRIRDFIINYNRKLIEDRGVTGEAEIFGIICEWREEGNEDLTMKDIATKYSERYETGLPEIKKITSKKVGGIVRNKLKFKTERDREGYRLIYDPEQVEVLKRKFGVSLPMPPSNVHTFTETAGTVVREGL